MKRNIWIGFSLFIIYHLSTIQQFHIVKSLVLLSITIFIPVLLWMIDNQRRSGSISKLAKWIFFLYPIAAIAAVIAFITDYAFFALVWFVFTALVAFHGISRLLERGRKPIEEFAIDSGLIYLLLGGFWFFVAVANIQIMNFSSFITVLTAIHFHYSAIIVPIFVGLLGRKQRHNRRMYGALTVIVMISPMTIAIGITYSRTFEFFAVLVYMLALFLYSIFVFRTPFKNKLAKALLSFSSVVLMLTITFSFIYAFGRMQYSITIPINLMVYIHGLVNAFGFVIPALIGWIIEGFKQDPYNYYGKPMSAIYGNVKIGKDFLNSRGLVCETKKDGLIESFKVYSSSHFDVTILSPLIIDFYEHTNKYEMRAKIGWANWFKPFAFIYQKISRRIQQIHLSTSETWGKMNGNIIGVRSEQDGRKDVRAWIRENESGETIFVALYSAHKYQNETYMNIGLPLPFSNMTGILKLCNRDTNLLLSSKLRKNARGDEGIYLHTPFMTMRLPLEETFLIKETQHTKLIATHKMWIFGLKFLEINYEIEKNKL